MNCFVRDRCAEINIDIFVCSSINTYHLDIKSYKDDLTVRDFAMTV